MDQKYRMWLSYEGTRYSGWQVQPNSVSIQGLVEKALNTFLKQEIRLIGAGRTDAGVHAQGQVAHFCYEKLLDCQTALNALNGILPFDIRIKHLEPTHPTFHAQYSALSKEYHYHLWLDRVMNPFYRLYRHQCFTKKFSVELLKEAAHYFLGTHDFATFANVGSSVKSTIRTLTRLDCIPQEGGFRLEFEGNGFLYKMVRNIVGTLLEVATHKRAVDDILKLLAAKDRRAAGMAAPAKGLFLVKINYPDLLTNKSGKEETYTNRLSTSLDNSLISERSK